MVNFDMEKNEQVDCAICGNEKAELLMQTQNIHGAKLLSKESFNLMKCQRCGLIYLNPRPKGRREEFYGLNYYNSCISSANSMESYWTAYVNLKKRRMLKEYKQKGKMLDVGCGAGDFLAVFKNDEFDLYGVEPSFLGYSLSSKKIKGTIFKDKIINCGFAEEYFDVVTLWHVFEHMDNPNQELSEINRILAAGGLFFISVPNANSLGFKMSKEYWFHMDSPRHLYNYTPATITNILNKNGFKVIKIVFPSFEYPLDFYHSLLNKLGRDRIIRAMLMLPVFVLSFIVKSIFSWFRVSETMVIISVKKN